MFDGMLLLPETMCCLVSLAMVYRFPTDARMVGVHDVPYLLMSMQLIICCTPSKRYYGFCTYIGCMEKNAPSIWSH